MDFPIKELCPDCHEIVFEKLNDDATQRAWSQLYKHGYKANTRQYNRSCTVCSIFHTIKTEVLRCQGRQWAASGRWQIEPVSAKRRFGLALENDTTLISLDLSDRPEYATDINDCGPAFLAPVTSRTESTIVGRSVGENIDWSVVKEWMSFCLDSHSEHVPCRVSAAPLELRCIDCQDLTNLRVTKIDPTSEYITLSYVWGLGCDEEILENGLPEHLPCTIQDAVHTVKSLGYRWLWVDRYSMPENDKAQKHEMLLRMGDVYGNSVLTIIAAAGDGPDYGLPGVRNTHRLPQPRLRVGSESWILVKLDAMRDAIKASKWNERAWTYQEALLSRRKLVFADHGVYFQCANMSCVEDLAVPLEMAHTRQLRDCLDVFPSGGVGHNPLDIEKRINEYCPRYLTYGSDSFKAFQGILEVFEHLDQPLLNLYGVPLFPDSCYGGRQRQITFETKLFHGLSWTTSQYAIRRPKFPSWSWVGYDWKDLGKIDFRLHERPSDYDMVRSHEHWTIPTPSYHGTALVKLSDNQFYAMTAHHTKLFQKLREGCLPEVLRLYGFVFNVSCHRSSFWTSTNHVLDVSCVSVNWPFGLRDTRRRGPARCSDHKDFYGEMTRGKYELRGFVLTFGTRVSALLLARRPGTMVYERIGLVSIGNVSPGQTGYWYGSAQLVEDASKINVYRKPLALSTSAEEFSIDLTRTWVSVG